MHELSISSAIVDTAIKHARGQRVTVVEVKLGRLRQVVPDSLAFYFEIVSRETACDGAELRIEHVDAQLRCPACWCEWDPAPPPMATHEEYASDGPPPVPAFRCLTCGEPGEVLTGGELEVESIEITDEASAIETQLT
jgi:hydrogenase nickel incorporation protein HypA/HybF